MSRVHLGMKRPIRQFEKSYDEFKSLINCLEMIKPKNLEEKDYMLREKLALEERGLLLVEKITRIMVKDGRVQKKNMKKNMEKEEAM